MKSVVIAIPLLIVLILMFIFSGCGKNDSVETQGEQDVKTSSEGSETYTIDLNASKVEWIGKKVTGQHNGTVNIASGELMVNDGELEAGKFEIDLSTIKVLDLQDPESNNKLTTHLKSDDFFSADKHRMAVFEITDIRKAPDEKGNTHVIDGNLTIKEITKNILFPAKVDISGDKMTAKADFNIDRTEWDIKFRSGKFFENLGDKMIDDDFNIKFDITANKR